jgi:spore coat protein U-like protein
LFLLAAATPLFAAAASCSVTASPLVFPDYASPGGSQADTSGTITVTCIPDLILLVCRTPYTLSMSSGNAGDFTPRRLAYGGNQLDYNLYTNAARTIVWGDGSDGSSTVSDAVNTSILGLICLSGSKNHTVHARIPGSQNVVAGSYSDTVTVTVTY